MKTFQPTNPHIILTGRANKSGELYYNLSGVRARVKAAELSVIIEAVYTVHEPWVAVTVNGALLTRFAAQNGVHEYIIYRNASAEVPKNIAIIRETQAMGGDTQLFVRGLITDDSGSLEPAEPRSMKIEVIGDSITSGEGAIGSMMEQDWISAYFSAVNAYPYKLGEKLNADVRVFSQSGFGVTCSWDGNEFGALPRFYDNEVIFSQTAGTHDFSEWQPDAIVVNLGTNDSGGKTDPEKFRSGAVEFLKTLRKLNPSAHIIWAVGMLGSPFVLELQEAVTHIDDCSFLQLTEQTFETIGARGHPGERCHEQASETLAEHIRLTVPKLDETIIENSIIRTGSRLSAFRLSEKLKKAAAGVPITVVCLGDSITGGSLARNNQGYVSIAGNMLHKRYPNATVINAGIGATDSRYAAFRLTRDVLSHNPDIVTVEFINDTDDPVYLEAYESVVRDILSAPSKPAVVLLEMCFYNDLHYPSKSHDPVAIHYDLPTVSVAAALKDSQIDRTKLSPDGLHPNDLGHRYIANGLYRLFCEAERQDFSAAGTTAPAIPEKISGAGFSGGVIEPKRISLTHSGESAKFSVRGSKVNLGYMKLIFGGADAELKVDGIIRDITSKFPGGWGSYLFLEPVIEAPGDHEIEITLKEDGMFEIAEIAYIQNK